MPLQLARLKDSENETHCVLVRRNRPGYWEGEEFVDMPRTEYFSTPTLYRLEQTPFAAERDRWHLGSPRPMGGGDGKKENRLYHRLQEVN